jgi:hypothetical protein
MANEEYVKKILKFATKNKIIVHIFQTNIDFIVDQRHFSIMELMAKQKITKMKPLLAIAFKFKFMQAQQSLDKITMQK